MPNTYILKQDLIKYEDFVFPGWEYGEDGTYCVVYAVNSNGEKSLYQLDKEEMTYQRFTAPSVVEDKIDNTFIGKLSNVLENHMDSVILGAGLGFIVFVIIIVILSVKLYNRNAELDEIYDEYGIDDEDEDEEDSDDDYEYDDYASSDEDEKHEDSNNEMMLFVQEGMKEVFPDEEPVIEEQPVEAEEVEELKEEMVVEPVVKTVENQDTLGEALAKQKEEQEEFYDDDDVLENFSMDFIDLDD